MQEHLDNYQQINARLRGKIQELEAQLRAKDTVTKISSSSTYENTENCEDSRGSRQGYCFEEQKVESGRRSFGDLQKENHPLTPKSRVSIDF